MILQDVNEFLKVIRKLITELALRMLLCQILAQCFRQVHMSYAVCQHMFIGYSGKCGNVDHYCTLR